MGAALFALALLSTQPSRASESACTADTSSILGAEHPAPPDEEPGDKELPYDKVFRFDVDNGLYAYKRWCADQTLVPDTTEYYVHGKVRGYFRHRDYWDGRHLELSDEAGRVRILKTNITDAFERVLIFDANGQVIAPLGKVSGPSATRLILEEFAKERLDPAIVMLWLLHYHGEGNNADNMSVFTQWLLANKDATIRFSSILGPKITNHLALGASVRIHERPKAREKFAELYPKGTSPFTDAIHKLMKDK